QLGLDTVGSEAEQKHPDAGPAIRSFLGRHLIVDAALGATTNHGCAETSHRYGSLTGPFHRIGGDNDARGTHAESFGKGVVDDDAIDVHRLGDFRTHLRQGTTSSWLVSRIGASD